MKSIDEVEYKLFEYHKPKRWSYEPLIKQVLEWALKIMRKDPPDLAEAVIRIRIEKLEYKQTEREVTGFATKPARAVQINALKWVVDEYDLDGDKPISKEE